MGSCLKLCQTIVTSGSILPTLVGSDSPGFQTTFSPNPTERYWGMNLGPSVCIAEHLPLSYGPHYGTEIQMPCTKLFSFLMTGVHGCEKQPCLPGLLTWVSLKITGRGDARSWEIITVQTPWQNQSGAPSSASSLCQTSPS